MGGTTSLSVDSKIWKQGVSHEMSANFWSSYKGLASAEKGEYKSLGVSIISTNNLSEFDIEQVDNFSNVKRKSYITKDSAYINDCCLEEMLYTLNDNQLLTCDPDCKNYAGNGCDTILFNACINSSSEILIKPVNTDRCRVWIRSVVERESETFNDLLAYFRKEEIRQDPLTIEFISALRYFASDVNNYNNIADNIIEDYSEEVKNSEYKCAFSPNDILFQAKNIVDTPKECWYKECALSPKYKLLSSNILNQQRCQISICSINMDQIDVSNNNILITCKNEYTSQNFDIEKKNPARTVAKKKDFYIPSFPNTAIPLIYIGSLIFF